ncbi:hypothetical protein [Streptomyces sp. NBC_00038]|uniref:hypothetical protein n=1 Tax=Streptomyces sp. NBC_00038 TaxID=2903615 RepID=UPI0022599661|nr:hypothetical protein [Streptomyces sp. NBC_00038]MCX5561101.1 hypothetical protein [Streptomyces sp. NBC_00038]
MNIFDNTTANASFGALLFGAMATVAVVAGFKYKILKNKKTFALVFFFMLLVTVNSTGILGEIAGALRHGMNVAGERAAEGVAGAKATPNPPRSTVTPVSAGGAGIGLCGLTWYVIKLFAARGKPKDWKEMAGGSLVAVCYGTTLGFMGVVVGAATLTGNNVGLWIFGG